MNKQNDRKKRQTVKQIEKSHIINEQTKRQKEKANKINRQTIRQIEKSHRMMDIQNDRKKSHTE